MQVRLLADDDRPWVADLCRRHFGAETVAALGRLHHPARRPGLVAGQADSRQGALCFCEDPGGAEVVLLVAEPPGRGAGSALLAALEALGRRRGWRRLRLVLTNDNIPALRFYQRRGWDLVAFHAGAVERDRARKPEIPPQGVDGIPLRHLLELQRLLPLDGEPG
jgi:GNAT superfamily N-acetyltransferase